MENNSSDDEVDVAPGIASLEAIVQGQAERNIMDVSIKEYLSCCSTMTALLNKMEIRNLALEIDDSGNPIYHSGRASKVIKLKLPMTTSVGSMLFGYISINEHLPRGRGKKRRRQDETNTAAAPHFSPISSSSTAGEQSALNPAMNKVTVSAQTYQNYKSALRWWHGYNSTEKRKLVIIIRAFYTIKVIHQNY